MEAVGFRRAVRIAQAAATMQPGGLAGTMQAAHTIGIAAVMGEEITGIRTMDILGSAITAWAMATHITVIAPIGIIRTDTITLTATDTRCI
jgi:hypothetical protein